MTIPFYCVVAVFLLVFLTRIPVAVAQARTGKVDNKTPREQQAKLEGWGKRAHAAHLNTIEGFAPFAAAVIISHVGHASESTATTLAIVYVVLRLIYPALYIADIDKARSPVWLLGYLTTLALFLSPLFG